MPEQRTFIPEFFERRYMLARFSAVGLLTVMVIWTVHTEAYAINGTLAYAGLFIFVVATIAVLIARTAIHATILQVLVWVASFDLLAIACLGIAYRAFSDPAYPMLIGIPVFYSLAVRRRDVWGIGLASSFVYVVVNAIGGHLQDPISIAITIIKASIIVIVSAALADTTARYVQRETEIMLHGEAEERMNEQLQRRLSELQAVSQITEIIHSSLEFERVGQVVLEILTKAINVSTCCLLVIDKARAETLYSASVGLAGAPVPFQVTSGPAQDLDIGDTHFSCVPVVDHKQMMVVFCTDGVSLDQMSEEDRLVLQAVASELLVAAENSQLYKLTKRLAITDELTGLFNYRYLQQRLDEEIERARRYRKDFSFVMIDADDFKNFNDSNGHIAGDRALEELGDVMRGVVREVDVVCRYGGEEFSVILPETDAAGAFVVAEKLREAVAKHEFADAEGRRSEHVTVSVGIASYPTHAGDKESLLKAADDALYRAKEGGKNRVRSPQLLPPHERVPAPGHGDNPFDIDEE